MAELVETLQSKAWTVLHKMQFLKISKQLYKDKQGVTLVEYSLIAALIGIAAITALQTLGTGIGDRFNNAANAIANPNP